MKWNLVMTWQISIKRQITIQIRNNFNLVLVFTILGTPKTHTPNKQIKSYLIYPPKPKPNWHNKTKETNKPSKQRTCQANDNGVVRSKDHLPHTHHSSGSSGPLLRRSTSLLENLSHHPRDPRKQTDRSTRYIHSLSFFRFDFWFFVFWVWIFCSGFWNGVQVCRRSFWKLRNRWVGTTTNRIRGPA